MASSRTASPSLRPAVPPLLAMAFAILAVSTASILIRYAQRTAPSLVIAAWRLSLAALVLAPVALKNHRQELASLKKGELALLGLAGVFLALHFASWISSLEYTSVASSAVLVASTPLWVALLAPLFLKERLSWLATLGLLVAVAGGALVGLNQACQVSASGLVCDGLAELGRGPAFSGNLLALAGAWFATGYLLVGRRMRGGLSLVAYTFLVYGTAALVLLVWVGLAGQPLFGYPPLTILWFGLLALVPQLLGHSTFNWALRYLPAAFVSVMLLGEPVGAALLALALLGEALGGLELAGGILILLGIYLAARRGGNA